MVYLVALLSIAELSRSFAFNMSLFPSDHDCLARPVDGDSVFVVRAMRLLILWWNKLCVIVVLIFSRVNGRSRKGYPLDGFGGPWRHDALGRPVTNKAYSL